MASVTKTLYVISTDSSVTRLSDSYIHFASDTSTYPYSIAYKYPTGSTYYYSTAAISKKIPPSYSSVQRTTFCRTYVNISDVCTALGISKSDITKIYAIATFSNCTTTSRYVAPTRTRNVNIEQQTFGISMGSKKDEVTATTSTVYGNSKSVTSTSQSDFTTIYVYNYYTTVGNESAEAIGEGMTCYDFEIQVTYNKAECTAKITKANIDTTSLLLIDVEKDIRGGKFSCEGAYTSSYCSSISARWYDYEHSEVFNPGSGDYTYMLNSTMELQYQVIDSGSMKAQSKSCTMHATFNHLTFTLDPKCTKVTINFTSKDDNAPYIYRYAIWDEDETRILQISDYTTNTECIFTGLDPETKYKFIFYVMYKVGSSSYNSVGLTSPIIFTTTKPYVSLNVTDVKCTQAKLIGTDSCGGTLKYYKKEGTGSYVRVYPDTNNIVYGLTPNTNYTFKCVSDTDYESTEVSITTTVNVSFSLDDSGDVHTQDFTLDYPRRLTINATSNCASDVTVQVSYDNYAHYTVYKNGQTFDAYKNCRARAFIGDASVQAGKKEINVTVSEPSNRKCLAWRSNIGTKYEYDNGSTIQVYPTSPYMAGYNSTNSYDSSAILTKTYEYKINGTVTSTNSTVLFSATAGSYAVVGKVIYSYGSEVLYTDNTSVTFQVIGFTNGYIYARSQTLSDVIIAGSGAVATGRQVTTGEEVYIYATGWGDGAKKYYFTAYTSTDGTSWTPLSDEDGTFSGEGDDYYYRTLIAYNSSKRYKFTYLIKATDGIGYTQQSSTQEEFTVGWLTARVGIVADVTITPEPPVGKKNDTVFNLDASNSFVRGYSYTLQFEWFLYLDGDVLTDRWNTLVTVVSGSKTSSKVQFKIKENGDYRLILKINGTYYSEEDEADKILPTTTWESPISIKDIIKTNISDSNRFSLMFYNGTKCFIASRSSVPYMTKLKFDKSIGNIGTLTCSIIGANRVRMDNDETVQELLNTAGTYVCLLDRMNPIWIGILTDPAELDTNYYDKSTLVSQYDITAYECTRALSTDFLPNNDKGLISGTLTDIVKRIIPTEHQGQIGKSTVNYGVSLSNTSRLTALDQLYGQCGWRYRCRPDTVLFWRDAHTTMLTNYIVVPNTEFISLPEIGDHIIFYNGSTYGCGIINAIIGGSVSTTIVFSRTFHKPRTGLDVLRVSIFKSYLIDFKPTYYQTYNTRTWTVNQDATKANVTPNIRDQFGTAIVYGVGYSGETIASKMRAWMKINKDYTIDNSMRITRSYDSEIDTIVKLDEITPTGQSYTYSRYTITFNGWSFPDKATLSRLKSKNILPTIFFVNLNRELHNITVGYNIDDPTYMLSDNPRRYFDQGNNKKCAYTIAVRNDEYAPDNITKKTSIIESLVQMSNVTFNTFAVDKFTKLPENGKEICVGDMICTLADKDSQYSEVVVNYNAPMTGWEQTGIPHGHLTDVLVMDNSQTINYSNPDITSPYAKFPETSLTVQGPEGYSMMEMERLACRYMQYGSNYSAQCKATISAPFFYRDDFEIGVSRLPLVGDRIAIAKMETDGYVTNVYELQSYEFDYENFSVNITFGMPILSVGEVIYNMLANSGMSMIPADS